MYLIEKMKFSQSALTFPREHEIIAYSLEHNKFKSNVVGCSRVARKWLRSVEKCRVLVITIIDNED